MGRFPFEEEVAEPLVPNDPSYVFTEEQALFVFWRVKKWRLTVTLSDFTVLTADLSGPQSSPAASEKDLVMESTGSARSYADNNTPDPTMGVRTLHMASISFFGAVGASKVKVNAGGSQFNGVISFLMRVSEGAGGELLIPLVDVESLPTSSNNTSNFDATLSFGDHGPPSINLAAYTTEPSEIDSATFEPLEYFEHATAAGAPLYNTSTGAILPGASVFG